MNPKPLLPQAAGVLISGASLASVACAADITGYAVLTTDYVFRGVTYSDGHSAVQAGADMVLDSGLYLGVWASSVDISGGSGQQRDLQLNYYLGYSHDFQTAWSIGANIVSYTFPGTEGDFEYDFLEYSIVANYDDRVWFEYSHSADVFHSGSDTHNIDLYAEWRLPAQLMFGAGAGYYDVSELSGSGYAYWQAGITRPFGRIDVDLRYHDSSRSVPIISTSESAKARIALSAKFLF